MYHARYFSYFTFLIEKYNTPTMLIDNTLILLYVLFKIIAYTVYMYYVYGIYYTYNTYILHNR